MGSQEDRKTDFEDRTALLEAIVLNSQDAVLTKDLNGVITSWNPAAERMFGYTADEMIGQPILKLIPEDLHYEEVQILLKLRAGERIDRMETIRLNRNAEPVYVSLTISPLTNSKGKIIGASKVIRDISKQRELDNLQRRLAAIVESSDDAIISKNLDGTITSWNAAAERLFGYTSEEIIGQSILTLIPKHLHEEETRILAKLRAGERIDHFETVRLTKSGKMMDVSLSISPLRDAKGDVIGASKILRDISQQKQMQQSLLQAEKIAATGRMAATIAHEINNPLEGLVNLIYLAKTTEGVPVDVCRYLSAAEEELERISHIAKQTLGFYREHSSAAPLSISGLIHDLLEIYGPRLKLHRIVLEKDLDELPKIVARRGELSQVISNLIVNSIHAMPQGGKLSLSVKEAPDKKGIEVTIADTGSGISAEHLEKIFEPFFTTRGEIGTGIGLWIAQQFIEGHMGTLNVETKVGKGTAMRIFLPWENGYGELRKQ